MNLTIHKMTEQDLEPLHRLLSDSKVMRFLEPPFTKEQTADFLAEYVAPALEKYKDIESDRPEINV